MGTLPKSRLGLTEIESAGAGEVPTTAVNSANAAPEKNRFAFMENTPLTDCHSRN
jgi:hypothetical protein